VHHVVGNKFNRGLSPIVAIDFLLILSLLTYFWQLTGTTKKLLVLGLLFEIGLREFIDISLL